MGDAAVHTNIGIVEMDTTLADYNLAENKIAEVESILITGANAGLYTFTIDGVEISVTTTAEKLMELIPFNRPVHSVEVTAIATSGKVFLLLRQRSSG